MGGLTLLTDPVWSADLKGIRRLTEPALPLETIGKIDGVLLSHNHYDHLDWPTLERLPKDTPCFVGAGLARDFLKRGFRNVQELDWWQEEVLGPLRIAFVPAHHWSRRTLFDLNKTLWGGWVVTDQDGRRVYFAGDTAYGPFFHAIRQEYPGIDIALFPVGAYAPGWYNRNSHTNPEEAVQAVRDVGARVMVPIHWGTFPLSVEPWLEPIERTRDAWDAAGLPRRDLWDLELGETAKLPIPARPSRPVPKKARRVLISPQGKA
jgi:L-ascorbate metabolism protein UlaG (beta-lactamase superfamily)